MKPAMKAVVLSSSSSASSVKSSYPSAAAAATELASDGEELELKDTSCYFPGCRKDANCDCPICLDSINATLDLMPNSVQRSSLTKLSACKPAIQRTPISIDPTLLSTPKSATTPCIRVTNRGRSTAATPIAAQKVARGKSIRVSAPNLWFLRWVLCLGLIAVIAEFGFPSLALRVMRPQLSAEIVSKLGQESLVMNDLREKLNYLQRGLEGFVDDPVSSCLVDNTSWKVNQDGLLLHSSCVLHKSAIEETSIWGWPLRTTGLLTTAFSSRSFTLISGKITEWSNGGIMLKVRKVNSTWAQIKWSSSVLELEPNTWIVDYRRKGLIENPRLLSAGARFFLFRLSVMTGRLKKQFWSLPCFDNQHSSFSIKKPT